MHRQIRWIAWALALALPTATWGAGPSRPAADPATAPSPLAGWSAEVPEDLDARLTRQADLDLIVRAAIARNPDVLEARERVRGAGEATRLAGRLPDPELRYQLWNAPVVRPWHGMQMIGVAQSFPAPGSRAARTRAAQESSRAGTEAVRARQLDLAQQAQSAFADLYRADRELVIRREHRDITERIADLARANYQAGRVSQADVLRVSVELARIRADLEQVEQARASAQALLNALMDRPPDAPIGPTPALEAPSADPKLDQLQAALAGRPEIAAGESSVARAEALADAARREARVPGFMLGADYMYDPMVEGAEKHGVALMVSVNLPWFNGRHDDEVRQAESEAAAERRALQSARNAAAYQLQDALARYRAARRTFDIVESDLLPQARRSFEAAESAFAAAQGDALGLLDAERSYLQVRIDRERALASLLASLADLNRAAGLAPAALENP